MLSLAYMENITTTQVILFFIFLAIARGFSEPKPSIWDNPKYKKYKIIRYPLWFCFYVFILSSAMQDAAFVAMTIHFFFMRYERRTN